MKKKLVFIILASLLIAGFSAGKEGWAVEKIKFGNPTKAIPLINLPALAAEERGFWKEGGVNVERVLFDAGGAQSRAIAAGALQMAWDNGVLHIFSVARGVPAIMVGDMGAAQRFFYWVRPDSPVKGPNDLRGTRIGVTQLGSLTHAYGRVAAKALGIEEEIRFVAIGGIASSIAALKARRVDAVVLSDVAIGELKYLGEARDVVNVLTYLPKPWVDQLISARTDFANMNPDDVKKVLRGILGGADFVMKNRSWAINRMKTVFSYRDAVAEATYESLRYSSHGNIDRQAVESVKNFVVNYGFVSREEVPAAEKIFTTRFTE